MAVDIFGRNVDSTTSGYTGINIANLTNNFLEETEVISQLKLLI